MRVRLGLLGLALVAGLGASVAGASVSAGPAAARLQAFDGCPSFLAYVRKQALPLVGPWGLGGAVGIAAGAPGAARDAVAGSPGGEPELLGHERPGGGRRRARPRQDRRSDALRRHGRARECAGRAWRRPAEARRHAAPRPRRGRAPARRAATCSSSPGAPPAPIPVDGHRDPRAVPVSREDRHRGRRRPRPSAPARRPHARARRRLPRRATRRRHGAARARLAARCSTSRSSGPAPQVPPATPPPRREKPRRRSRSSGARSWLPGFTLRGAAGKVAAQADVSSSAARCRGRARSPGSAS